MLYIVKRGAEKNKFTDVKLIKRKGTRSQTDCSSHVQEQQHWNRIFHKQFDRRVVCILTALSFTFGLWGVRGNQHLRNWLEQETNGRSKTRAPQQLEWAHTVPVSSVKAPVAQHVTPCSQLLLAGSGCEEQTCSSPSSGDWFMPGLSHPGHSKQQLNNGLCLKFSTGNAAHSSSPPCFLPSFPHSLPPAFMYLVICWEPSCTSCHSMLSLLYSAMFETTHTVTA